MKASELIKRLQELVEEHGDLYIMNQYWYTPKCYYLKGEREDSPSYFHIH